MDNVPERTLKCNIVWMTNILNEYLPLDLVRHLVLPLTLDFNEELLTCIEMKALCTDVDQSAQLDMLMNNIISFGVDPNYNHGELLKVAIINGSQECVDRLVQLGADLNKHSDIVMSMALMSLFRVRMFKYLNLEPEYVTLPEDHPFKPSLDDRTLALVYAISQKNKSALAFFCQFDSNFVYGYLDVILAGAMMVTCDMDIIQFLMDLLASRSTVESLLFSLVQQERIDTLKKCIACDKVGTVLNTVFKLAAIAGKSSVLRMCIDLKSVAKTHSDFDTDDMDSEVNQNALHLAFFDDNLECAQLIAEKMDMVGKFQFMLIAIESQDLDKVKCMAVAGADCKKILQIKNLSVQKLIREQPQIFQYLEEQAQCQQLA